MEPAYEAELPSTSTPTTPPLTRSASGQAAIPVPYREQHYNAKRRAAYAFLIFTAVMFLGSIVINFVQADLTGAGSGINDTKILPAEDAKRFFEPKTPPPTTTTTLPAVGRNNY